MDKFVIRGGNPLLGTIKISGAKNSALPCMAAAILTEDEVILENIPQVQDIETERKLLESMGAHVELGYGRAQHRTTIQCAVLSDPVAKYEIVQEPCAPPRWFLAALIARTGIARVAMPGRLRHRWPPHRPSHQGPRIHGRDHHPGARLPRSPQAPTTAHPPSRPPTSSSTRSPSPAPKTSSWPQP